jgi:D-glycero-D-manno-heptose 1,7-bisphosphate phosphatase
MTKNMNLNRRKAVFLDRDGVLNHSVVVNGKPYAPRKFEDFIIEHQAYEASKLLSQAGFLLIVVTNQPDVGNGLVTHNIINAMNLKLMEALPLDDIKVCFHSQSDGCTCRKPMPGMLEKAALELNIDLAKSYMIGDRWSDIVAGKAAGCFTILIDRKYNEVLEDQPNVSVSCLLEAVQNIMERSRLNILN